MVALAGQSYADEIDWTKVDAALGKSASVQGDVHRYGIPRSDLQVTVDGVTIKPALALGGWLGFEPTTGGVVVMGDLVLTEPEIEPVMTKLLNSGIDVTALHNHLLRANPATYYMHVHGHGDPVVIATAIRAALAESKTPFGPPAQPPPQAAEIDLDTAALDNAIGAKGKINGGVYQFSVPRKDAITDSGTALSPAMGTATVINFQPTGDGKAAITGDFVITAGVQGHNRHGRGDGRHHRQASLHSPHRKGGPLANCGDGERTPASVPLRHMHSGPPLAKSEAAE